MLEDRLEFMTEMFPCVPSLGLGYWPQILDGKVKTNPECRKLPRGWLIGTWEFVHTTAPVCFPIPVVYHFDLGGLNYWELSHDKSTRKKVFFRRPYREQEDGFWLLWPHASHFHHCSESFDEILTIGFDSNLWWMRRLDASTPDLRFFVDGDSGQLIEMA